MEAVLMVPVGMSAAGVKGGEFFQQFFYRSGQSDGVGLMGVVPECLVRFRNFFWLFLQLQQDGGDVEMVMTEGMAIGIPGFGAADLAEAIFRVGGRINIQGNFRKTPQSAPDALRRALLSEGVPGGIAPPPQLVGFFLQ